MVTLVNLNVYSTAASCSAMAATKSSGVSA